MHGRPRVSVREEAERQSPQQQEASGRRVRGLRDLQSEVLRCHTEHEFTFPALQRCAELLQLNADVTFGWNFRKRALCSLQQQQQQEQQGEQQQEQQQREQQQEQWEEQEEQDSGRASGHTTAEAADAGGGPAQAAGRDAPDGAGQVPREAGVGVGEEGGAERGGGAGEKASGGQGVGSGAQNRLADRLADSLAEEKKLLRDEMHVVEDALKSNPKSYGAWHHRRWLLLGLTAGRDGDSGGIPAAPGISGCTGGLLRWRHLAGAGGEQEGGVGALGEICARELGLLQKLLTMDDRNFHGWDYRRFVADRASASPEQELAFTESKINDNFSNYSAWHSRSKLLPAAHPRLALDPDPPLLGAEFDLVRQAFFTEPEDQSGWMYFLWLLGQVCPRQAPQLAATWPPPRHADRADPSELPLTLEQGQNGSELGAAVLLAFTEPVAGVGPETVGVCLKCTGGRTGSIGSGEPLAGLSEVDTVTSADNIVTFSWEPVGPSGSCARLWRGRCTGGLPAAGTGTGAEEQAGPLTLELSVGIKRGIVSALGFELRQKATVLLSFARGTPEEAPGVSGEGSELRPPPAADAASSADAATPADVAPSDVLALALGGGAGAQGAGESRAWKEWGREAVEKEIESIRELQELEPDCKWVLFTLARLLEAKERMRSEGGDLASADVAGQEGEIESLYEKLKCVDPFRAELYEDRLASRRLRKALAHAAPSSSGALDLSGLGLSAIAPSPLLLGCQGLDLSRNRFRTAEGFELLQHVRSIDLSHNKIAHLGALRPLALLPHLTALDLSHNSIGTLSYDTSRYLFPSVLSNSRAREPAPQESDAVPWRGELAERYPEAWARMKDLQGLSRLQRLDMTGNALVDFNGYHEILKELLPLLEA